MHSLDDTIAAIASAAGGAVRGIVRISGPDAVACALRCFQSADPDARDDPQPRMLTGSIRLSAAGGFVAEAGRAALPADLYLWPTSRSYTRQPVAELHTLGSPPLLEAVLRTVCAHGARVAEPGEFTLRAFLCGRIDLVEAEAVLGVIDAANGRELDVALAQLAGGLTRPLGDLRDTLLDLLAELEAGLDFAEEDIQFISAAELERRLSEAAATVIQLVDQMATRGQSDGEPVVVLVGSPNVGKSSLFNTLIGGRPALVSDRPGTTRDYLTAWLRWGDFACRLVDTAGLDRHLSANTGDDPLAEASQQAAIEQHERADLRLLCLDATRPLNAWEEAQLCDAAPRIVVWTKCDVETAGSPRFGALSPGVATPGLVGEDAIATSTLSGTGIDALRSALRERLAHSSAKSSGAVASTAARCHESLRLAADCLARARDATVAHEGEELVAAEIRSALVELGKVVGVVYTDDVLDRIFSRFCIGK